MVAIVVSVAVGLALHRLGVVFEGRGEEIFEGMAMLLAAGVLTWMIFWMQRQGRQIQAELELDVHQKGCDVSPHSLSSARPAGGRTGQQGRSLSLSSRKPTTSFSVEASRHAVGQSPSISEEAIKRCTQ